MKRDVPPPDTVLGERYRVIRPLGAGAFGNVLEVEHVHTRHRRAMKLLNEEAANNPEVVERFLREASAAGRIGDRHIVETFDAGRFSDGTPYLVMELLDGVTVRALLHRDRQLSVGLACELLAQAAEGIHAAHQAGIVHRDLKPENLFVLSGPLLKILDFGVSRFAATDDLSLTQSNTPMGTPLYMPPEQFQGAKNLGREADIYSLGVVLYELLCGSPPFVADTFGALAIAVATTLPAPLSTRVDGLDPELEKIIARAMARERAARFASAEELAHALAPFRQAADTAPLHQLERQPIAVAAPDEPTFRPPQKATPMQQSAAPPRTVPMPAPPKGRWLAAVLGLALVSAGVWLVRNPPSRPVVKAPGPILVLPSNAKADWRELLAAEVIHRALALSGTPLVPLEDGERFRREQSDSAADALSSNEVADARKIFTPGPVLLVAVKQRDGKPALEVDVYLAKDSAKPDLHRTLPITGDDVSDAALALAHELRAELELPAPPRADDDALSRALPHASAELYAQGTHQLEVMDLAGAIDSLERAARSDPNNPLVLDALASAYDAAGHDDQALETAKAAQSAAGSASRVVALQIECRLRGFEHDLKQLQLACGALVSGRDSLEARLLYASGLARDERWDDAEKVLEGTPHEEASVLLAATRMHRERLAYEDEQAGGLVLITMGRERKSKSLEAAGHFALCDAKRALSKLPEAASECTLAQQAFYFAVDNVGVARAHTELGHIAMASSPAEAEAEYRDALKAARQAGSKRDEIASEIHLAAAAIQKKQIQAARDQLATAEAHAVAVRSGELESYAAAELGEAEAELSSFDAARAAFARASAAAQRGHLRGAEGFALHKLGRLQWQAGQLAASQQSLERANELFATGGVVTYRAHAAHDLADVLADRGQLTEAKKQLARARDLFASAPMEQAWVDADALRYDFEAGEPVDAARADALTKTFAATGTSDATGEAMALALRALAGPKPGDWVKQSEQSLKDEPEPDEETAAWVRLALAEAAMRAGPKTEALRLVAAAAADKAGNERLVLWSNWLQARLAGSTIRAAGAIADARELGYLAFAARAEKKK